MPKTSEAATEALAAHECARRGWTLAKTTWTERYPIPGGRFATRQRDLLGIFDGLAFPAGGGTVGLQWTTTPNLRAHLRKMSASRWLEVVRLAGWEARIWCFCLESGRLERDLVMTWTDEP